MTTLPDFERARRFLAAHPPPGEVMAVGVTGAHYYGFPSGDSDVDLKGVHIAPTEQLLGLTPPRDSFDRLLDFEGVEHDLTTHELGRAMSLLLRGNGNVLERLTSPLQVIESDEARELAALARGAISKRFVGHYAGFFRGTQREHARHEPRRIKPMLYSYRVALTGAHLLLTGEIEGDLERLAQEHGFEEVLPFVMQKREGCEHEHLDPADDVRLSARWAALEEYLTRARERSSLPESPPNESDIEAWVVAARLSRLSA